MQFASLMPDGTFFEIDAPSPTVAARIARERGAHKGPPPYEWVGRRGLPQPSGAPLDLTADPVEPLWVHMHYAPGGSAWRAANAVARAFVVG
jgi:hypothetical protein